MANIRQHGKRWQVRVRRKGHPQQVRCFVSKADALRWARQVESEIDRGVFVSRREAERVTLAELIDRFKAEVVPLHKGAEVENIRLDCMKTNKLARFAVAAISPTLVAAYRDARLSVVTSGTVLRELQILSSLLNHARKEWGLAIVNPVSAIRKPAPTRARTRRLSPHEESRLMDALELGTRSPQGHFQGARNPWVKPVVQIALETAMRRGELLGLRWSDIDLAKRIAHLPDTKNGRPRNVPLSSRAANVLNSLPRSIDGRVFPISANALKLSFGRAIHRAALVDLRFHDLRREATSRLAERLPNLVELAAVTGHADLRMLRVYYQPSPEDMARKLG